MENERKDTITCPHSGCGRELTRRGAANHIKNCRAGKLRATIDALSQKYFSTKISFLNAPTLPASAQTSTVVHVRCPLDFMKPIRLNRIETLNFLSCIVFNIH